MAVLTPNTLLYVQPIMIPEEQPNEDTPEKKDVNVMSTSVKRQHGKDEKKSICNPLEKCTI